MSQERFSDLAIIAMHYSERFDVDEICQTFVKLIQEDPFRLHWEWLTRYVKKR